MKNNFTDFLLCTLYLKDKKFIASSIFFLLIPVSILKHTAAKSKSRNDLMKMRFCYYRNIKLVLLLLLVLSNLSLTQTTGDLITNGSYPNFVVDSKHNMHVTWGNNWIWYGVFDTLGNTIKKFHFPNTYGCCSVSNLALTDDNVVIAWRYISQSFNSYIIGQVLSTTQDTANVSNINFYDTYFDADRFNPTIDFLNDTIFIISWCGNGPQTPVQKGIYGEITTTSLSSLGGNFIINDHLEINVDARLPQILVSKDSSKFLAVWNDNRSGSNKIYARLFDVSGSAIDSSLLISEYPDSGYIFYLSGATDLSTGNYAVVWAVENQPVWQVRLRWLDNNGIPIGPSESITNESDSVSPAASVDIDIDEQGKAVIVWEQELKGVTYIFGNRFDEDKEPYSKIFKISEGENGDNQIYPSVQLKDDKIFVIWNQIKDTIGQIHARIINFYDTTLVEVEENYRNNPNSFHLFQNYPNPFNPATNIKFQIRNTGFVILKIYDFLGKEVKVLINEELNPGIYNIKWKGEDKNGKEVSSGLYLYRLLVNGKSIAKKMLLIR